MSNQEWARIGGLSVRNHESTTKLTMANSADANHPERRNDAYGESVFVKNKRPNVKIADRKKPKTGKI